MDQGFFWRILGVDGVPWNGEVAARSPPLAAGRTDARNGPAAVGSIDRRARTNVRNLLRPDTPRAIDGGASHRWHDQSLLSPKRTFDVIDGWESLAQLRGGTWRPDR